MSGIKLVFPTFFFLPGMHTGIQVFGRAVQICTPGQNAKFLQICIPVVNTTLIVEGWTKKHGLDIDGDRKFRFLEGGGFLGVCASEFLAENAKNRQKKIAFASCQNLRPVLKPVSEMSHSIPDRE